MGMEQARNAVVSRRQAVELVTNVAGSKGRTVRVVRDSADLTLEGIRLPCVYHLDWSNCWIAFLTHPGAGLRSSDIVVIDKATGAIRYTGSANDEG